MLILHSHIDMLFLKCVFTDFKEAFPAPEPLDEASERARQFIMVNNVKKKMPKDDCFCALKGGILRKHIFLLLLLLLHLNFSVVAHGHQMIEMCCSSSICQQGLTVPH